MIYEAILITDNILIYRDGKFARGITFNQAELPQYREKIQKCLRDGVFNWTQLGDLTSTRVIFQFPNIRWEDLKA